MPVCHLQHSVADRKFVPPRPTSEHLHGLAVPVPGGEVLQVEEGSLYPALQRILLNGWAKADWGLSETNRRARYYKLTSAGRKQLEGERAEFERMVRAIQHVLEAS